MQSQETNTESGGAVKHPSAKEWMAYLYREVAPGRARELRDHAEGCPVCGEQLSRWRLDLVTLNEWKLPAFSQKKPRPSRVTGLKWAAAAAVLLFAGFAVGQVFLRNASQVAELKTSVARLAEQVNNQPTGEATDSFIAINHQTRDELIQLLADYSKLNEAQRTEDRRAFGLALRELELRVGRLRAELETVALNTESGFRQTKEGLTTLASYTVAARDQTSDLPISEKTNQ